jgi:biopolymer transport protein ExbD
MRRTYQPKTLHTEFELDLAPLLAVMVKLVPVLIVGSAFMQMSIIETDLPQVIQEAVAQEKSNTKPTTSISVLLSNKDGVTIIVTDAGAQSSKVIPTLPNGKLNLSEIHKAFVITKIKYPNIFKIDMKPQADVSYDNIVKVMDEARRSKNSNIEFPVFDKNAGKEIKTPFMFPDIVFGNVLEG